MRILSGILILIVKIYQHAISPLLGTNCRFTPTCSEYTIQSIKIWGPFKGLWLGVKRISKCHPWGSHGVDPVPKKRKTK
ncbi:MAG: membrane protein insertion efficiency factor YidD [Cryomorphaceae bacterium]